MKKRVRAVLLWVATNHPRNYGKNYPQLWQFMPKRYCIPKVRCACCNEILNSKNTPQDGRPGYSFCVQCEKDWTDLGVPTHVIAPAPRPRRKHWIGYWLKPLLQWFCGKLSGHEPSETEWGYGGGKFVDRNCRWCDKVLKVPIAEDPPPNDLLAGLSGEMLGD